MKRSYQQLATSSQRQSIEETTESNSAAPLISKTRACSECKRHKIRCEVKPGQSSCSRCVRQGLSCVVNNGFKTFVDNDTRWKNAAKLDTQQLQAAVEELLRRNQLPELSTFGQSSTSGARASNSGDGGIISAGMNTSMAMTRENSPQPSNEQSELVPAPMSSLYEVTKLRNLRSNTDGARSPRMTLLEEDFISRGLISLRDAEMLFERFNLTMNQFLWGGIALAHANLTSVRRSSSLLAAATLTVAALHMPNQATALSNCYNEFITLVRGSMLKRYHSLDEIRALCIGAFWLSDLSWKLSGHAVRIATEMNLHQSLTKMFRGHADQHSRAELWYLLYVCDHHFSVAYGRPPSIHEDANIRNYEAFLQSPSTVPGDVRLICQVALFIILSRAYNQFGSDIEQPLSNEDFQQLREYNVDVDRWRILWQQRLADSPYCRSYPSKGVVLHYHFAKFQINALSLRAIARSSSSTLSLDRKESISVAVASAMATLNVVLEEPDIRNAIVGVPLFTHTMIAFSAVFLIKIAFKGDLGFLNIDARQIQALVERVIEFMKEQSANASEKHLTGHIANGLRKMSERLHEVQQLPEEVVSYLTASTNGNTAKDHAGVNASQFVPPPDFVFDMVGTHGFGYDEHWPDTPLYALDFFSL